MNSKCFKIGTIQAFLDGELKAELSENVVKHVAKCDDCARLLSEVEDENAIAFEALDNELNVLVPTERLRSKVFASIKEIEGEERPGLWQRLSESFAFLSAIDLRSPSVVALCATILFVGTFAFALKFFPKMPGDDVVQVNGGGALEILPAPNAERVGNVSNEAGDSIDSSGDAPEDVIETTAEARRPVPARSNRTPRFQKLVYRGPSKRVKRAPVRRKAKSPGPAVAGEAVYLQTIATLSQNVDRDKDMILRPSERVDFERNLALINNTISRMKTAVRKNPKNKAAKELLKASYQNKIDLLNSVSERNELMASMQ